MSLYCDLDLEMAKQSFCIILRLMVMYHHTKFGYKKFKRLSGQTLIELFLNFHCDFDSHPQDTPAGTVSD